jgi:hypothetical protein
MQVTTAMAEAPQSRGSHSASFATIGNAANTESH